MKKIFVVLWLGYALGAAAQEETVTIRKVKKGEEPQVVMDAIKSDFPKAVEKSMAFLPGKLYGNEWNVTTEGERLDELNFYQVEIKDGNTIYTAVYDRNGKLLSSKQIVDPAKMPPMVQATVKKFAGWHVDNTSEEIKYNGKVVTQVYRVKLQKGQKGVEHKIVFIDPAGNIVNTRFAII